MAWVNLKNIFDSDIFIENINTKSWSWIMLGVVMNVLCFVLMVSGNQHMASVEMYIFSVNPVLMTC